MPVQTLMFSLFSKLEQSAFTDPRLPAILVAATPVRA
jgi:hypothetical protein